jgi:hypothetical protein
VLVVDCPGERDDSETTLAMEGCGVASDRDAHITHDMVLAGAKILQEEFDAAPFLSRSVARAIYTAMEKARV